MKGIVAVALTIALGVPAAAQIPSPFDAVTDPADRPLMSEAAAAISAQPPNIVRLDAVLAKLPRPTSLRGIVQTARASVLAEADMGRAIAAVEDALRLLPNDPWPKLMAAYIFTFSGAPQRAADLWIRASRESPEYARATSRYQMDALIGRLNEMGDLGRADRLAARLGEIGFSSVLASERSTAALPTTREEMREKRDRDALAAVTTINDPDDLLTLYVDRRYTALWLRIMEWAGTDLSGQTQRYLEELRSDWIASDDFVTAVPYARMLSSLNANDVLVELFLPMFDRLHVGSKNEDAELLAPVVARALARLGRSNEARGILVKTAASMPLDYPERALNIDGAYLTLAFDELNWDQVITLADAFLARTKSMGGDINRSAVVTVVARRACAAWRTGRTDEAQQATAVVLLEQMRIPSAALELHLCRGDAAAARAMIVERLADEATRGMALRFLQPVPDVALTPRERLKEPVAREVRTAPEVMAAANRVGRILPRPVIASLPHGFDPHQGRPRAKMLRPGET